jgi:hypothetical protein
MFNVARRAGEVAASLYGGAVFGLLAGLPVGWLALVIVGLDSVPGSPEHEDWATLASVAGPVLVMGVGVLVIALLRRRGRELSLGFSLGMLVAAFAWWWIVSGFLGAPG